MSIYDIILVRRRVVSEMYCPMCGKKQVDDASFCFSCGTKIVLPIQDDESSFDDEQQSIYRRDVNNSDIHNNNGEMDLFSVRENQEDVQNESDILNTTNKTNRAGYGCLIVIIILTALVLLIISNKGGYTSDSATCKMCGRSWKAGDTGGNYMSIALSGMCKNCETNYKWAQSALGN